MHADFKLFPNLLYLNHAAVAPWPVATADAVKAFAEENVLAGAMHYPDWLRVEQRLRERIARLISAPAKGDVALVKNTSEALSFVAHGLPWERGDNVVGIAQEFPSNRIVWDALADRGVELRLLDLYASTQPEADLQGLCDRRTRLISVSGVQYARGLRLDLPLIGEHCRTNGILFCVDAIQQVGALPFDVQAAQVDFAAADGHKWMLGPEGLGFLYVRERVRDTLRLSQFGWHMVEASGDYERLDWTPARDARRFECGSPNMLGVHALEASLALIEHKGIDTIAKTIYDNVSLCIELSKQNDFNILSSTEPARRSGIFTFAVPGVDAAALHEALMADQVICAQRGGGIRFSPHFHTPADHIHQAFARVLRAAERLRSPRA